MRSARVLLATATATAALAIASPGAHAGDWEQEDSSYGSEHHLVGAMACAGSWPCGLPHA
ncbi:hypothetical protein [Streptomyces sp. NPDC005302]|uniref:hypothetical protein n=1 Tax=Streptomyces sp. NPDC005302 TaxID=3154675 RepID=UPI0033B1CB08